MDELPDFDDLIPPGSVTGADAARHRLRGAVVAERRRVRREWFLVRSVLVGTVIFVVWAIAPTSSNRSDLPLVGLAEATAKLPAPIPSADEDWYVREERSEWINLSDRTASEPREVTVRVDTVSETWVDLSASTIRRTSVSKLDALAPEDAETLALIEASEQIDVGRFESDPVEINYPGVHPMWAGGADAVYGELARAAGESGDIRLDRLSMLRSAAVLMHHHGAEPSKRSVILLAISRIPGIEVEYRSGLLAVVYQYVQGDIAYELRFDFDRTSGVLVGESIATLATPTAPGILLSQSRYEARLAIDEASGS
jgi:hypothetical protein